MRSLSAALLVSAPHFRIMQGFARIATSGYAPALAITLGFSLLTFLFPLAAIASGAIIVLLHIKNGFSFAVTTALMASVFLALSSFSIYGHPGVGLSFAALMWLPTLVVSYLYVATRSLSITCQALVLIGIALFLGSYLIVPDIEAAWTNLLNNALAPMLDRYGGPDTDKASLITSIAKVMTGGIIASTLIQYTITLIAGRWLYGQLDNSQPVGPEFRALRLGKILGFFALACALAALTLRETFIIQLFIVSAALFGIQGLAILHSWSAAMTNRRPWLIISYVLLFLLPQFFVVLITTGILDTTIDFRRRFKGAAS